MSKQYLLILLLLPAMLNAQNLEPLEIGGSILLTSYEGDFHAPAVNYALKDVGAGVSAYARWSVGANFGLRANVMAASISGHDNSYSSPSWRLVRNASFKSPVLEVALLAEIYPLNFFSSSNGLSEKSAYLDVERQFSLFAAIGIGGVYCKPVVAWNDANGNPEIDPMLAQLDKENKTNTIHLVLPFGGGIRYRIADQWSIFVEGLLRPTFSDYLDGFSKAGNPGKGDWYATAGIGVGYNLGGTKSRYGNPLVH